MAVIEEVCAKAGVKCALSEVFAKGGEGGKALAETVLSIMPEAPQPIQYTYDLGASLPEKIEAVAKKIYRADGVTYTPAAEEDAGRPGRHGLRRAACLHCQNAVFFQR